MSYGHTSHVNRIKTKNNQILRLKITKNERNCIYETNFQIM